MGEYVPDYKASLWLVNYERAHGKKVGLTRGTFDLINPGHLDFLSRAKELCDVLLVNINNVEWYKNHKGKGNEPVRKEINRIELIKRLEPVDYVFMHPGIGQHIHPAVFLALYCKPDFFIRKDEDPRWAFEEKRIFSEHDYHPDFVILPRSDWDESSSEIRERVKEMMRPEISIEMLSDWLTQMRILHNKS